MSYIKLNEVAAKIYLYSYPFKNGILRYKLLNEYINTHLTSFNRNKKVLIKNNYIDYWKIPDKGKKQDKYKILARTDPLIYQIEQKFKNLDDFDKHVINKILSSDTFRKIIGGMIKDKKKNYSDPVNFILQIFDLLIIENKTLLSVVKKLKRYGAKFNFPTIKAYDLYCENFIPKLKKIIPIIIAGKPIKKQNRDFMLNVDDAIYICIPNRTYLKIKSGLTFIAKFSGVFQKIHKEIDKIPQLVETTLDEKGLQIAKIINE
jgi:hypothetical protein